MKCNVIEKCPYGKDAKNMHICMEKAELCFRRIRIEKGEK
jgi:hypothetical protein